MTCSQDTDSHFKLLQVKLDEVVKNQRLKEEKNRERDELLKNNMQANMAYHILDIKN